MSRRITAIFLVAMLLLTQIAWADEPVTSDVNIEAESVSETEIDREFAEMDTYTDRFIIKLKDDSLDIANVVSTVENNAKANKMNKLDKLQKKLDKLDNKEVKEKNKNKIDKKKEKVNKKIERLADKQVIKLEESVDPEVFIEGIKQELGNSIEYIQPDYQMELSDTVIGNIEIDLGEEPKTTEQPEIEPTPESTTEEPTPESEEGETTEPEQPAYIDFSNRESNLEAAHNVSKGTGVIVALIDTGVDIYHTDLQGHFVDGYDFFNDTNTYDAENHGTHIAGVIAKTAPEAKIMPLKVFENGTAYTSDIIEAIQYAESNGAKIANCSWGSSNDNQALKETIQSSGMLFVCAAGNNRQNIDEQGIYPAAYGLSNIISVGAINNDGGMTYFSNYGTSNVHIAAWGREVESTLPNDAYGLLTGTSISAGFVTGGAALSAEGIEQSAVEIKTRLLESADKLSCLENKVTGGNVVNFNNIVNSTTGSSLTVTPEDDFDVYGYQNTPEEDWELFCGLDNKQVAAGSSHSLVLKEYGSVWAFGYNEQGQLGLGHKNNTNIPERVILSPTISQIAANEHQSMAMTSTGYVYVWGANVGNGTSTNPVPQLLIHGGAREISCGVGYSLVLMEDGTVYSWGANDMGQLGRANQNNYTPTLIPNLEGVTSISAGGYHALALMDDGKVKSWGKNNSGQLGDGSVINRNYPDYVKTSANTPINNVESISAGASFNLMTINQSNGTKQLVTWGHSGYGQSSGSKYPSPLSTQFKPETATAGYYHSILTDTDGNVYGMGYNNYGQLGVGSNAYISSLAIIKGLINVKSVAPGLHHTLMITEDDKVVTFGDGAYGQLGDGRPFMRSVPTAVDSLPDVVKIAAGQYFSLALMPDGTVSSWGENIYGQLGTGHYKALSSPAKVKYGENNFGNIKEISAGMSHSMALDNDGFVWTWGNNSSGQLGNGTTTNMQIPIKLPKTAFGNQSVISISSGENHCLALTENKKVYAWGLNSSGQLGDGAAISSSSKKLLPYLITSLPDADKIAAGGNHNIALLSDGTIRTWGLNSSGQLGNDSTVSSSSPVIVSGCETEVFTVIGTGVNHTLAANQNGVKNWGYNAKGQLGNGLSSNKMTPHTLNVTNAVELTGGLYHTIIRKSDNTLLSIGGNAYGQLASGSNPEERILQTIKSFGSVTRVSSGRYHVMALTSNGIYTWGYNNAGQLGDGSPMERITPYRITDEVNDIYGTGFSNAHEIFENVPETTYVQGNSVQMYYMFKPTASGKYVIKSTQTDPNDMINLAAWLYDANDTTRHIAYHLNFTTMHDFYIEHTLYAGRTYYIKTQNQSRETSKEYSIIVQKASSAAMQTVTFKQNDYVYIVVSGKNIASFTGKTFYVDYNDDLLQPVDYIAQTYTPDLILNEEHALIKPLEDTGKAISFKVNKTVNEGKCYNGVVNIIKFKAKNDGSCDVGVGAF